MHIDKLSLINFKNYDEAAITFAENINCLLGLNGSGKTNVLDAIHYLSMTKSAHNTLDTQNIKFNEKYFSIKGAILHEDERKEVVCYCQEGVKKSFKVNKKDYDKLSEHIGKIPTVLITPYDTDIIREGSEVRRRFFDSIISQFDHEYLSVLIKYNVNLKQRNSALKRFGVIGKVDNALLGTYNELLVNLGRVIHSKRQKFISDYELVFTDHYKNLGTDKEAVGITYMSQFNDANIEQGLAKSIKRDIATERSNYGTHKDDFKFLINNEQVKKYGSQGQQKTFAIALKLAQFQTILGHLNIKPILLLDDIFDKLDSERIIHLLKMINDDFFGQVFITDAREERTKALLIDAELEAKYFHVENGTIIPSP